MSKRGRRENLEGVVRNVSGRQTVVVQVSSLVKHQQYMKYLRRDTVLQVHDQKGEAQAGDRVLISRARPLSRTKHYRLVKVIEKVQTA